MDLVFEDLEQPHRAGRAGRGEPIDTEPTHRVAPKSRDALRRSLGFGDVTRMAQEHHACAVVLGLDPSDDRYDTCVRSLDRSLSDWDQARLVESNRTACAEKGLQPGTPAFAVCVVNAGQSP